MSANLGNFTGNHRYRTYGDPAFVTRSEATIGENMVIGVGVYMPDGGTEVFIGDATDAAKAYSAFTLPTPEYPVNGTEALAGQPVYLAYAGEIERSGLSPGQVYYANPAVPGGITKVKPAGWYQIVGRAITDIRFFVDIYPPANDDPDADLPIYDSDADAVAGGDFVYMSSSQHESLPYGVKKRVLPALIP
jgi:hypothetical protein